MNVGILGGGMTGLALSGFLKHDNEVLEKDARVGGLCRSVQDGGFTFDCGGSHIIFSRDGEVLDFMIRKLGDNKVRVRRNTKILFKGRYVKYPFENGLADLEKEDNFDCLYHYVMALIGRSGKEPANFREWIYETFGKGIAEKYMVPYNEKVWNTKTELLGLDWVAGRVPQPPVEDVIKSSLGIETEGYAHQLYFYYPRTGGIESLVRAVEPAGNVTTGFEVSKVRKEGSEWVVSDGREEKVFDRVVSTLHLHDLVKVMDVPKDVAAAVGGLKTNSLITVMLGIDRPKINDISWLYIPDRDVAANRVSFPSNYSDRVAPPGKSSVLAEITCMKGDGTWKEKDADLVEDTVSDLHRLGIIDRKDVCYSSIRRSENAYVICDLDYARYVRVAREYFKSVGLDLCGRFSEFSYLNMDACIRHAMDKAAELNRESH